MVELGVHFRDVYLEDLLCHEDSRSEPEGWIGMGEAYWRPSSSREGSVVEQEVRCHDV